MSTARLGIGPSLKMSGAIPPSLYIPLRRVQAQFCVLLLKSTDLQDFFTPVVQGSEKSERDEGRKKKNNGV
jgi:hypothetical protein